MLTYLKISIKKKKKKKKKVVPQAISLFWLREITQCAGKSYSNIDFHS